MGGDLSKNKGEKPLYFMPSWHPPGWVIDGGTGERTQPQQLEEGAFFFFSILFFQ